MNFVYTITGNKAMVLFMELIPHTGWNSRINTMTTPNTFVDIRVAEAWEEFQHQVRTFMYGHGLDGEPMFRIDNAWMIASVEDIQLTDSQVMALKLRKEPVSRLVFINLLNGAMM